MPVYNAENYLDDCLQSIQGQSYANWELIIVNDYSTDDSNKIIQEWCKKDQRLMCYQNVEKGIIPALNLAFTNTCGKYITRMDADDLMPSNKLQLFAQQAVKNPKSIITGKVSYFAKGQVSEGYLRYEAWLNALVDSGEFWNSVYRECVIASPNWMVPRSCFEDVFSFSDLCYPEDYDMVLKWYENGFKVSPIQVVTHYWREHPDRTSRNSDNYQQKAFFNLKTQRFVDLELKPTDKIQLIGAGVKGKLVASILKLNNISFDWFDFNANKKNQHYEIQIKELAAVKVGQKSILTVWPEDEKLKKRVLEFLKEKELVFGSNCWLF
jgi:glycosyltransferase involved in cell wall biosynthesis